MSTDNDGHHYLIPTDKQDRWDLWRNLDSEDERVWTVPNFAIEVGGSPESVTFEKPKVFGKAV